MIIALVSLNGKRSRWHANIPNEANGVSILFMSMTMLAKIGTWGTVDL